jgi:hypothetical protein
LWSTACNRQATAKRGCVGRGKAKSQANLAALKSFNGKPQATADNVAFGLPLNDVKKNPYRHWPLATNDEMPDGRV